MTSDVAMLVETSWLMVARIATMKLLGAYIQLITKDRFNLGLGDIKSEYIKV